MLEADKISGPWSIRPGDATLSTACSHSQATSTLRLELLCILPGRMCVWVVLVYNAPSPPEIGT